MQCLYTCPSVSVICAQECVLSCLPNCLVFALFLCLSVNANRCSATLWLPLENRVEPCSLESVCYCNSLAVGKSNSVRQSERRAQTQQTLVCVSAHLLTFLAINVVPTKGKKKITARPPLCKNLSRRGTESRLFSFIEA